MIILGIDPGTAKMGWGIIQYQKSQPKAGPPRAEKIKHLGHGLIKTPSSDSIGKRLAVLKEEVEHLLKEHKVDEVVVEKILQHQQKKCNQCRSGVRNRPFSSGRIRYPCLRI